VPVVLTDGRSNPWPASEAVAMASRPAGYYRTPDAERAGPYAVRSEERHGDPRRTRAAPRPSLLISQQHVEACCQGAVSVRGRLGDGGGADGRSGGREGFRGLDGRPEGHRKGLGGCDGWTGAGRRGGWRSRDTGAKSA
jgi:hypothetical protein